MPIAVLILTLERNGFQILFQREKIHKISLLHLIFGEIGTKCSPPSIGLVCVFMPFRETDGHLSKLQSHYKRLLASILGIRNLEPRVKVITRIDLI